MRHSAGFGTLPLQLDCAPVSCRAHSFDIMLSHSRAKVPSEPAVAGSTCVALEGNSQFTMSHNNESNRLPS